MHFIPNQTVNAVFLSKTLNQILSVLVDTLNKVGGHACIKGAIAPATKHVNVKLRQRLFWIPAFAGMTPPYELMLMGHLGNLS